MEKTTKIFQLRLDQETKDRLQDLAKKDERSLNNFLNIILKEYLENKKTRG